MWEGECTGPASGLGLIKFSTGLKTPIYKTEIDVFDSYSTAYDCSHGLSDWDQTFKRRHFEGEQVTIIFWAVC